MRLRARTDGNQLWMVTILRMYPGISIKITSSLGEGFPDIVVGYKKKNYIFEIKDPAQPKSKRKLTEQERGFHLKWQGQVATVEHPDEILKIIGYNIKGKK